MSEHEINDLIMNLVKDINTRALRKYQNREAWTISDCKQGADHGREVIKIINEKLMVSCVM